VSSTNIKTIYTMKATPEGALSINLKEEPWKIENEFDSLWSGVDNAFILLGLPEDQKILLKADGVLIFECPNTDECNGQYKIMKKKIQKSKLFQAVKWPETLDFEKYTVKTSIIGSLCNIVPTAFSSFLSNEKIKASYEPRRINFEFFDPNNDKNFIRIYFNSEHHKNQPLIDISVESNIKKHADETMNEIKKFCEKER
jgi:hypothetical protein